MEKKDTSAAKGIPAAESTAKIAVSPRKVNIPSSSPLTIGPRLKLSKSVFEPVWHQRGTPSDSPKVPLIKTPTGTRGTGTKQATRLSERRESKKRGILAFFGNRRKGRSRVVNLILLPLAAVITTVAVLFLLKIL